MDAFIEILKLILPATFVMYGMYIAIKSMISKSLLSKELDLKLKSLEVTLPVRMQAFERMALLLERISPDNMLVRLNRQGMTASELHHVVLEEIRSEFNHNVAQQVYLSPQIWSNILVAKEDFITKANATFQEIDNDASSIDYAKKLLELKVATDMDSIEFALTSLKEEMGKYYQI